MSHLALVFMSNPLTPLEHLARHVLNWLHFNVGLPWAWSIVALTVMVRILLVPLTVRQIHSMQNLQRFAPQMKEIQKKYKTDKQKQNQELMKFYRENNINPAASCLPMLAQLPVFLGLYYSLRHFSREAPKLHPGSLSFLHFIPSIAAHTTTHWGGYVLLVVYVAQPARVVVLHVGVGGQDAADAADGHAGRLRVLHREVPGRARPLLGDDQPVDGGPGADHAAADAEDRPPRRSAPRGRRPRTRGTAAGTARSPSRPGGRRSPRAATSRRARCGARRKPAGARAMSAEQLTVEATGETVGEAKWAALRELEQRHPGLDKSAVRFEVVSEGERGLLGVGYAPARVVASVPASAVEAVELDASEAAADLHGLVLRIVNALGVDGRVDVREDDAAITLTCVGADVGLLIGRHGQTIDAVQYLLNAIAHRALGDERKEVVVDAAGYRERRRATLESMAVRTAQQVEATGERVELEPMTAVERKVVHLKLKEFAGVQTASEGAEPNRYVVVLPAD